MNSRRIVRSLRGGTLWSNKPRSPSIHSQCWSNGLIRSHLGRFCQCRGVKSKTTLKASSLPQGALPPLSQVEEQLPTKDYPPFLRQHLNNMHKFPDCVLLTRVGDFYELYFDHVGLYAPLVNLKQAKRATPRGDVAMAGFQHTQLDRYLKMFVQEHGKQVAISEQIRLPGRSRSSKQSGPLFDRKVTRVVTAGTLIDESFMDPYDNNYVLAVSLDSQSMLISSHGKNETELDQERIGDKKVGLSWADVSSGDLHTQVCHRAALSSVIASIGPREIVLDSSMETGERSQLQELLGDGGYSLYFHSQDAEADGRSAWDDIVQGAISIEKQKEFTEQEIAAGNLLLDYIGTRLRDTDVQLQPPVRRSESEQMSIDKQALRGLELRTTVRDGRFQGSLLHTIRQTVTKGGARLLNRRLVAPSMSLSVINSRLDLVEAMMNHDSVREDIVSLLRRTSDTHRLLQKFSIGRGDADDLLDLAETIDMMRQVASIMHNHAMSYQDEDATSRSFIVDISNRIDLKNPKKLAVKIQSTIDRDGLRQKQLVEEADEAQAVLMSEDVINADAAGIKTPSLTRASEPSPKNLTESRPDNIWIMRKDASQTLAEAHGKLEELLSTKDELAVRLRTELGSESLTLKWSAQLGHFCHVKGRDAQGKLASNSNIRVVGATRSTRSFYLTEWTHLGNQIDETKLRIQDEEEHVFDKLRKEVLQNLMRLRRNAAVLDELDVACSSATVALQRRYVRPLLNNGTSHRIFGGRHPTVDVGLGEQGRHFTANDCTVGDSERIYLVTGPNMAGKSTYLRQNALITILAQIGSFVPAEYAEIGLVDKIFSRIGSADNLYQNQSTFMVEMLETAEILKHATPRSFVIMDEVGRGTTPEDGVAVGYACIHHLHEINHCRTLFATHFHSLADMTEDFQKLACYCTEVLEDSDGSWTYVHKLRKGVNRNSHALKVARMAGMPESCVKVAAKVLNELRGKQFELTGETSVDHVRESNAA